jgi:hypothetical protein
MAVVRPSIRPWWPVLAGPALLVLGVVLLFVSDALLSIGPFDRATFGWAFCVPLLAIAPAASGLAGRWSSPTATVAIAGAVAIGSGLFVLGRLVATARQIGCESVDDPVRVAAHVLPLAVVTSLAYGIPAGLAYMKRSRPIVAGVAGVAAAIVGGVAMVLTFAALFPGVTCVPTPAPLG